MMSVNSKRHPFEIPVMIDSAGRSYSLHLLILLPPSLRQCPSWLRRIRRRRLSYLPDTKPVPASMQDLIHMLPELRLFRCRERRPHRSVQRYPQERVSWPHTWISRPHYRRQFTPSSKLATAACSLEDRSSKQITIPQVSILDPEGVRESRGIYRTVIGSMRSKTSRPHSSYRLGIFR